MFKLEQTHSSSAADIAFALANSVSPMLGSHFNNKWIITEDEQILSHDILVFLQNIDIEHPIGHLIRTCCEEYHSSFGCGTKTVLYLIGQWTNLCYNLKSQGIPLSKILLLLKECIKDCIAFLDQLVIPTDEFLDESEETQSRKNEEFGSQSSLFMLEDSGNNDILPSDNIFLKRENSDLEDDDISWFLSETNPEILPAAGLDPRTTDAFSYDGKKSSCQSRTYLNNNALSTPTDSTKPSSFSADEEFEYSFDYLDTNDASGCEKIFQDSLNETNSKTGVSSSLSLFSSNPPTQKTFKADHFLEYLNLKCQQFQKETLSNTAWSSRHLSSSNSEHKSLEFTDHEDTDILKPCFIEIPESATETKNIQPVQLKTLKNCQSINSSVEHSRKLDFHPGIKSSWSGDMCKYLSDLQIENDCATPEISKKENSRDHFSVPESNSEKFHIMEFPKTLVQSADFKIKDFSYSQDVLGENLSKNLESLVHGLCHGSNEYIDHFLIKAIRHQKRKKTKKNKRLRLHMNMLHLCCIQGPCIGSSRFISGVVLSAKEKQLHFWDLTKMQNQAHNVLLVKTSVTHNTHHVGYKKLAQVENICSKKEFIDSGKMSTRDKWIGRIQWILKQLNVTVLVAAGKVDKDLEQVLSCNGILVFENTEQSAIEALAASDENSRTEPVVYITDATQKNILTGLLMEPLNADRILPLNQPSRQIYIVLSTPQCQVQTLVLHHPARSGLDLLEQEFWLASHRVSSALNHGKILPGGGTTEQKCADYLLNKADLSRKQFHENSTGHELYKAEILLKLAESFQSFAKCVSLNSGHMDSDTDHNFILDDHFTKIQAWKTALQLVSILSRIDAQIVLGTTQ